MGDVSSAKMIGPAASVAVVTAIASFCISRAAGVGLGRTFLDYARAAALVGLIALLVWIGQHTIQLARDKAAQPLKILRRETLERLDRLVITAFVAPLFFAEFTTAKTCIGRLVGFRWDQTFTDMDAAIFGTDPWRITHALLGPAPTWALAFFYTYIFGFTLAYVQGFVAIYAKRRTVGIFFLAMFLTWFLGGVIGAYALSSAGPAFASLSDPALGQHFAPLLATLRSSMPGDWMVAPTQHYLAVTADGPTAIKGGGISAMPSMHIASAMLYVMLARGTKWQWLAVPFLALTWLGSVHFGYHYAIDGLVAIPIAVLCWYVAQTAYPVDRRSSTRAEILV